MSRINLSTSIIVFVLFLSSSSFATQFNVEKVEVLLAAECEGSTLKSVHPIQEDGDTKIPTEIDFWTDNKKFGSTPGVVIVTEMPGRLTLVVDTQFAVNVVEKHIFSEDKQLSLGRMDVDKVCEGVAGDKTLSAVRAPVILGSNIRIDYNSKLHKCWSRSNWPNGNGRSHFKTAFDSISIVDTTSATRIRFEKEGNFSFSSKEECERAQY